MTDCIFCKIIKGELASNIIFENDYVVAFPDLNPVARVHVLIVPKIHVTSIYSLAKHPQRGEIMAAVTEAVAAVADQYKTGEGFRLITNNGEDAGQTVMHLHFHLIGGEKLPVTIL